MVYSTRRFVLSFAWCYFVLVFFSPFEYKKYLPDNHSYLDLRRINDINMISIIVLVKSIILFGEVIPFVPQHMYLSR